VALQNYILIQFFSDMLALATGYGHGKKKGSGHKGVKGHSGHSGHKSKKFGKKHEDHWSKHGNAKGKHSKGHHDSKKYHGDHFKGSKGHKGAKFGKKGHKHKGHVTKGFKNTYHKNEFSKKTKFYDSFDNGGYHKKFGGYKGKYGGSKGNKFKGGKLKGFFKGGKFGKKHHLDKGKHFDEHKGHKGHYDEKGSFGHKSSHSKGGKGKKHHGFKHKHKHHGYGHGHGHDHGYGHSGVVPTFTIPDSGRSQHEKGEHYDLEQNPREELEVTNINGNNLEDNVEQSQRRNDDNNFDTYLDSGKNNFYAFPVKQLSEQNKNNPSLALPAISQRRNDDSDEGNQSYDSPKQEPLDEYDEDYGDYDGYNEALELEQKGQEKSRRGEDGEANGQQDEVQYDDEPEPRQDQDEKHAKSEDRVDYNDFHKNYFPRDEHYKMVGGFQANHFPPTETNFNNEHKELETAGPRHDSRWRDGDSYSYDDSLEDDLDYNDGGKKKAKYSDEEFDEVLEAQSRQGPDDIDRDEITMIKENDSDVISNAFKKEWSNDPASAITKQVINYFRDDKEEFTTKRPVVIKISTPQKPFESSFMKSSPIQPGARDSMHEASKENHHPFSGFYYKNKFND